MPENSRVIGVQLSVTLDSYLANTSLLISSIPTHTVLVKASQEKGGAGPLVTVTGTFARNNHGDFRLDDVRDETAGDRSMDAEFERERVS